MWQPSWSCPREGWFFPPTLFTEVSPAATIAQVEIFGPVVVMMTFRTPSEAVELANNTRYGLAASVWKSDSPTRPSGCHVVPPSRLLIRPMGSGAAEFGAGCPLP